MPRVASFEELNRHLLAACRRDDVRVVHRQSVSIGQAWQEEQPYLRPLPSRPFECCVTRQVHLNGYSQVTGRIQSLLDPDGTSAAGIDPHSLSF